jgi:hypothetical protein
MPLISHDVLLPLIYLGSSVVFWLIYLSLLGKRILLRLLCCVPLKLLIMLTYVVGKICAVDGYRLPSVLRGVCVHHTDVCLRDVCLHHADVCLRDVCVHHADRQ